MAHQKGSTVVFQLGYEATYGGGSSSGYVLPINSFNVAASRALNRAATLQGSRNPVQPFAGNLAVDGSIVIPVDSIALAYWLIGMFGLPTTSGASSPYTHEWKIPSSQRSMEMETAFTDLATAKYQSFVGCKISGFSIMSGGDGELVMTINVMGQSNSFESSSMDSTPTTVSFARLNQFHCALKQGGSTFSIATEFTLNVNFPMTRYYVIGGGGVAGSLAEETVEVSGNIKTLFENTTLLDLATAGTETSLELDVVGASTSTLEMEIQELIFERKSVPVPGPQGLLVDLNFQGYYTDGAEASAITTRLKNAVSSYAAV